MTCLFSTSEEYINRFLEYNKGRASTPHTHNEIERSVLFTQVIYVKSRQSQIYIYDDNSILVEEITAYADDVLIMLSGGHGYEILEDNTKSFRDKKWITLGAEIDRDRLI